MVSLGGFDTHADERATQQRLLGTLDAALTGFLHDMAGDKHGKNVVLLAYSRVRPPGARQTRRRAPTTAPPGRCSSRAPA